MSGDHNMNQTSPGWRKRQIALNKKAENARELGLDYEPSIIEMAREAQLPYFYQTGDVANLKQLEAFAALVREEERKKFCAVLRQLHDSYSLASNPAQFKEQFWQMTGSKE